MLSDGKFQHYGQHFKQSVNLPATIANNPARGQLNRKYKLFSVLVRA